MSGSGNESVLVAVIAGTNGAGGEMTGVIATRLERLGAAEAIGASGLRIINEMMRHAIKVFET
jgi:hypothetical protein